MILDLDIGNSRIKWRLLESPDSGVLSKGLTSNLAELKARFVNQHSITKVRVSSVRDREFLAQLTDWVQQKWKLGTEVAIVARSCHGLKVAYEDMTSLGVDRWLAMLAAYGDAQSACMVVDCGTALTIDSIDPAGQHLGGIIVPGLRLLPKALTDYTGIRLTESDPDYSLTLGKATDEAVYNGALALLIALIEKTITQESASRSDSSEYTVFFTGGDADLIFQFLSPLAVRTKVIPGLVFDGLSIALHDLCSD